MPAKTAKTNRAFTLVEILVVIAITAVLFALLLGPLVNSFRLTQRAQMLAGAQDQARIRMENLTRELGSASYVFSNTTHPFSGTSLSADENIPNLQFTNFLVFDAPQNNGGTIKMVPAVAFNAKLDFVLPRHNASGDLVDPTTGQPVTIRSNGTLAPTGLTFPLAPGTTMIRYWVGLRDPTKPYAPRGEGPSLIGTTNNTYVLYRAQFPPDYLNGTGQPAANPVDGTTVNSNLFADMRNAMGQYVPEFDDPDFFRYVTPVGDPSGNPPDINWLSSDHHQYTQAEAYGSGGSMTNPLAGSHNYRVQQWMQIAKPVINLTNVDLVLLPHNSDNSIDYDTASTLTNVMNTAHSGAVHDPVTGTDWPVVNSSVTFRPASVSADATASTTSDYAGAGYGGDVASVNNGLPYVPAVYTATDQSWAFPYQISLYQYTNTTGALFDTSLAGQTVANMYAAGDLIEMYNNGPNPQPVYDITSGLPLTTTGQFVPMTVTPDTGTINFDMPALPNPPTARSPGNPYQRYWIIPPTAFDGNPYTGPSPTPANYGICSNGVVNLADNTQLPNTPLALVTSLGNNADGSTPVASPDAVQNAHLVPGSLRVYGPDATPGPNEGQSVLYTQVTPGASSFGPNEYTVDYATNSLTLYLDPGTRQLPAGTTQASIEIAFDYQANMAPGSLTTAPSADNPYNPLRVKVGYQTRDLLDVNLGVRVYDPNNVGPAQIVTVHNQVRIGNSNR